MVFSTTQNRHLYVAKNYSATVDDTSAKGTIGGVKVIGKGKEKELFFLYKGDDNTLKSDRIQLENLSYIKAFNASDMITPLKSVKVSLDASLNSGLPVAGQDYILWVEFSHWVGTSELDQYAKNGCVHAVTGDVAQFYQKMVDSLNLSFSREIGATKTSNPYLTFSADATGITITEKEQDWHLGTDAQERVLFEVRPSTIFVGGDDVIWAAQDATTGKYYQDITPAKNAAVAGSTGIGNGKKIADLEYFCMGERGDQYRNIGWPNVVATNYLVDPNLQYHVLEIHHGFRDEGVNSYRSEKDITIVCDDDTELNNLIGAINTATGLNVATV